MRIFLLTIFLVATPLASPAGLKELFTWDKILFKWGGLDTEKKAELAGSAPGRPLHEFVIPTGASIWNNKVFISTPRRNTKVPATLSCVYLSNSTQNNVPLKPYPSWELNQLPEPGPNPQGKFISVHRTYVDPCDRLWFVDSGIVESPDGDVYYTVPALVAINLNTDQVITRQELPIPNNISPAPILSTVVIDVTKYTCDHAYAYIPDQRGYSLYVYSLKQNSTWKVSHNYFYLEPRRGEFFISRRRFHSSDGITSIALTNIKSDGYRDAYFHSLAGLNIYKVSTRILRNQTLATRRYHEDDFNFIDERTPLWQASNSDLHRPTETLFLGLINQNAIGCWNIRKPIQGLSIIAKDNGKLIYPSDIKIVNDKIYVLTNSLPDYLYGTMNYSKTNFRLWYNDVSNTLEGTNC